ncbi:LamB/YcsF family protein [Haloglycomyces albus]|uniref:LamB/YcsF family protein n=1 Tax=Haloglycomyces albus TaxID=526067 RepID=UPI00046CCB8A|nr:5-oxoprolinase subunit PxpA [Haloglycomyces albus]
MDLNADLAEGFGRWQLTDDEALLDIVTSANIACGFHAGDPWTMRSVCFVAQRRGVNLGAQVSYRDLAGFGRREMDVPRRELTAEIIYQIGALQAFARAAGDRVAYVKPHGALYHRANRDQSQARAIVDACHETGVDTLVCAPHSPLRELADFRTVSEVFADRAYDATGSLVPRGTSGAVLSSADAVRQAVGLAKDGKVTTVTGERLTLTGETLCLHGDTPGGADTARLIRDELDRHNLTVEPFLW